MPTKKETIKLLQITSTDVREKNTTANRIIANEISDVRDMISKIIITTKANKNRLKKLYKKDKKINNGLIKFNRNKDKEFLKIVTGEINTVHNNHKRLEEKFKKNKDKAINEINQKILFYQNENIRLSSKLLSTEKQNKIINENLIVSESKKNELIKLIRDLNNHFFENNIVNTNFKKKEIKGINNQKNTVLDKEIQKKLSKSSFDKKNNKKIHEDNLNEAISNIFN